MELIDDFTLVIDNDEGIYTEVHEQIGGCTAQEAGQRIREVIVRYFLSSHGIDLAGGTSFGACLLMEILGSVDWAELGEYYLEDLEETS